MPANSFIESRNVLSTFHGWRRKVGVGALIMACVVMGECLRKKAEVETAVRNVELGLINKRDQGMPYIVPLVRRIQAIVRNEYAFSYYPYLYLAGPLILLSAYLMIWKPREVSATRSTDLRASNTPSSGNRLDV